MNDLTITQYINQDSILGNIKSVLKERTPQFITSVVSLVNTNEKLAEADRKSVLNACLIAASLNLPINQNLGYAYIIPYKDTKSGVTYAQYQMGYKGFIQLAMRSNQFQTLNVTDVREGEILGVNHLSGEIEFKWAIEGREGLKTVGFVAYLKLINGFEKSFYMTTEQLKQHGLKFSQTFKRGFGLWKDDFDSMAKKTTLKLLLSKYAPMNTEMAKAVESDQALIKDEGIEYVDNKPTLPEDTANEKEKARVLKHIKESKDMTELELCTEAVTDFDDEELNLAYLAKLNEFDKAIGAKENE